ncbi:Breast cancer suppressor protein BRCT [Hirsutella rhossiliensis]|uniref:Breast cancer suppressor protein BRCT n=1 Tax=Hirsutella rhossiliensis TaxID=111463 RepID=A0A9P8MMK4_9HYPO|nr:Breast cancer suppressor protein BRCT [Hirsutella rhossiliensis]KAH0957910.1 Breast cancer suppressor protein BRCT [Hirsutella rhossiliensis]
MESPPKRITRARAAAKAGEATTKQPTKIVTSAAKARTAGMATAGTKSTAAKRKTRADENENEDSSQQRATATRALRATRARGALARKTADEAPRREEAEQPEAAGPARARGRPRKTPAPETKEPAADAAKKTARGRPAAVARTNGGTAAKPAAAKKTVKFQEPDKENVGPKPKPKEPVATGLRGRPARRGGAAMTAARSSTRAAASTTTGDDGQKKPLSPKKVTQMPITRDGDSSEDELAAEKTKTPVKAMMVSPIKPPAGVIVSTRKRESAQAKSESIEAKTAPSQDAVAAAASSSLGSPPRRLPSSPVKDSLKSPAKRMGLAPVPGSAVKTSDHHIELPGQAPGLRTPLLQSAAKRLQSPIKGLNLPSTAASGKPLHSQSAFRNSLFQSPAKRAMPGWRPLTEPRPRGASCLGESPEMQPLVMATPSRPAGTRPSQKLMAENCVTEDVDNGNLYSDSTEKPPFSGRLSSVLPRHIDPALREEAEAIVEEEEEEEPEEEVIQLVHEAAEIADPTEPANRTEEAAFLFPEPSGVESVYAPEDDDVDPMALDEIVAEMEESAELLPQAEEAPTQGNPMFQLREKDMDPCHDLQSESEDEDEPSARVEYMAPTPARPTQTPKGNLWRPNDSRRSTIGLTSLAEQFGSWSTVSPVKPIAGGAVEALETPNETDSPFKGSFFDDEMLVHTDNVLDVEDIIEGEAAGDDEALETPLDEIMITEEDVALAQEANDMSAMEPEQIDAVVNGQSFDDSLSEASQEYGDENETPMELPAVHSRTTAPVTPARPQRPLKTFFTTTKVPLKPADDSTPSPLKKRSLSASRVSHRRPGSLSRSATVISYSPSKDKNAGSALAEEERITPPCAPVTPSKTDMWSTMGTPARTPRRDLNPALLRGAVVFVDVHTTEGADASGIFVELLGQMGARCVKTWHWNPTSPTDGEASSNKVGITHVVYKDGGKRTLEKVRWANGLVHCVGVSWVLDCERENEWLDEAPFYIDTSNMPRGGARRRKSMEPKALANLNGTVVSSPAKGASSRTPNSPANRRDSTIWMRTPSDQDEQGDADDDDLEWSCVLLTPVPKTPAPEAVARYAAELPETPYGDDDEHDDDYVDSSPAGQALVTRTCPPKRNQYRDMGEGILARDKDEQVLMRLMAARRKSLQFAPKIGSPLSRTWG